MSILIRGMEIPKDYKYVDVRIFRDGSATTASAEEPFYKKMDVVEVPTPHGRLIDADALSERLTDLANCEWNQTVGTSWANAYEEVNGFVEDAMTIIEEEIEK